MVIRCGAAGRTGTNNAMITRLIVVLLTPIRKRKRLARLAHAPETKAFGVKPQQSTGRRATAQAEKRKSFDQTTWVATAGCVAAIPG